jgi:MYXO-CTERM domain-containing protein
VSRLLTVLTTLLLAAPAAAQPVEWQPAQWEFPGAFGPDIQGESAVGNAHLTFVLGGFPRHLVLSTGGSLALDESYDEWAGEATLNTFGPAVALGPDDDVHLVWKTVAGKVEWNLWYARRSAGAWTTPLLLNQGQPYGWGPQAASDSHSVTVAASNGATDYPDADVRTWTLVDATTTGLGLAVLPARSDDRVDITAGSTPGERYLFSGVPDVGGAIHWAYSTDGGASWTGQGTLASSTCSSGRVGQPDAALAPDGTLHLVYGCSSDTDVAGGPSVRHVTLEGTAVGGDQAVTSPGELTTWSLGHGIGRVAVNDQGTVAIVYLTNATGALLAISSDDGGASWHPPQQLAATAGAADGRDAPTLSAAARVFFLAYPTGTSVHFLRGLGPLQIGDDDDDAADDDDASDDDDDAADDDSTEDDDGGFDDDDSGLLPAPDGGCCEDDGGGSATSALPLLILTLPTLRRRRRSGRFR